MELKFEWDPQKAASNLARHGVPFEEAATVFGDPLGRITSDPRHSVDEDRFVLLGFRKSNACLPSCSRSAGRQFASSARGRQHPASGETMNKAKSKRRETGRVGCR